MTRSAGRWSPFAALITSPTATWYYQPRTSRGRERESVAVVHTGGEGRVREDEDRKVEMERKKINKETNSKHIRGERQRFQFLVDEKSTTISPVWSEVLFPFSANHLETAKQLAALGCCPTRGHVLTQMRLPYLFKKNFGTIFNRFSEGRKTLRSSIHSRSKWFLKRWRRWVASWLIKSNQKSHYHYPT